MVGGEREPLDRPRLLRLLEPHAAAPARASKPNSSTIPYTGPAHGRRRTSSGSSAEQRAAGRAVAPVHELDRRRGACLRGTRWKSPFDFCRTIARGGGSSTSPRLTVSARMPVIAAAATTPRSARSDLATARRRAPVVMRRRQVLASCLLLHQLAQDVPRARLRLLDPRDVLRARDDDVVGERARRRSRPPS